jgi:hypothetical protein
MKIPTVIFFLIATISCGKHHSDTDESSIQTPSLSDRIKDARCIFVSDYCSPYKGGGSIDWKFSINETLLGEDIVDRMARMQNHRSNNLEKVIWVRSRHVIAPDQHCSPETYKFQSATQTMILKSWVVFVGNQIQDENYLSFVGDDPCLGMIEASQSNISKIKKHLQDQGVK